MEKRKVRSMKTVSAGREVSVPHPRCARKEQP